MAECEKVEKLKQGRRDRRSKVRQDQLVADYIYCKYYEIYCEAAQFYNELNQKYPTKYDLRKSAEYKMWKIHITGQTQKLRKKLPKPFHQNIDTPIHIHPQSVLTVIYDEDLSTNPTHSEPPSPESNPESPAHSEPPSPESNPESPAHSEPPSPESNPESPAHSEPPPTPGKFLSTIEQKTGKHMQLRIPLIKSPAVITETIQTVTEEVLQEGTNLEPSLYEEIITETLQTVTEEVLQEGMNLEPSLYEEISPEVIEKIIAELRAEPELQNIVTNIEQELEFEQVAMDIDISDDDRLEKELEIW